MAWVRCDHLTKEGCPELKAVLQWLAASEGRRSLLYFPFELKIGPAPLFARRDCLELQTLQNLWVFHGVSLLLSAKKGSGTPKNIISSCPGVHKTARHGSTWFLATTLCLNTKHDQNLVPLVPEGKNMKKMLAHCHPHTHFGLFKFPIIPICFQSQ